MKNITLPTVDDSLVSITVGDQKVEFDILEYNDFYNAVIDDCEAVGDRSRETFIPLFAKKFEELHGIKLSNSAASILLIELNDADNEFKKKYSQLLESTDSTESPKDSTTSNSNASES